MVLAATSWYSVGPIITLHGRVIAREYMDRLSNHLHTMNRTVQGGSFQRRQCHIHIVGTVQSRFDEHAGELQHLPLASTVTTFDHIVPLWAVLESTL